MLCVCTCEKNGSARVRGVARGSRRDGQLFSQRRSAGHATWLWKEPTRAVAVEADLVACLVGVAGTAQATALAIGTAVVCVGVVVESTRERKFRQDRCTPTPTQNDCTH